MARVRYASAAVVRLAMAGWRRMRAAVAKAAAVASVADVLAGPYRHCPVAAEGGLADGSPTMLSTAPSLPCRRAR